MSISDTELDMDIMKDVVIVEEDDMKYTFIKKNNTSYTKSISNALISTLQYIKTGYTICFGMSYAYGLYYICSQPMISPLVATIGYQPIAIVYLLFLRLRGWI